MKIIRRKIDPFPFEEGKSYDEEYFTTIVKTDTDFYVNGNLLFRYRRHVIDNEKWFPIAENNLKKTILTSNNRRRACSDPSKRVNSGIIGFFDRLTPQMKHTLRTIFPARRSFSKAGRPTAFLKKHPEEWMLIQPMLKQLDKWYLDTAPLHYHIQKKAIDEVVPDLLIKGTVFTTVTINRNWRTFAHTDKGDFKEALSCIGVLGKNIKGGFLGFPRFKILVAVRPGDAILMDPHEAHCNTEIDIGKNGSRFSFVCYLRNDLRGMTEPFKSGNDIFFVTPTDVPFN